MQDKFQAEGQPISRATNRLMLKRSCAAAVSGFPWRYTRKLEGHNRLQELKLRPRRKDSEEAELRLFCTKAVGPTAPALATAPLSARNVLREIGIALPLH